MPNGFIINNDVLESYTIVGNKVVTVPDGVVTIGEGAFKGFTSIEEICLPETVTTIKAEAFKGCRKLAKINYPKNLIYIGEYAFHRCHSLKQAILPETVKSLPKAAFLYCDSLNYVSIPGVTLLSKQVFLNNDNLKTVEISKDLDPNCLNEVFTGCIKLSAITIGGTVYNIRNIVEVLSNQAGYPTLVIAIVTDIFRMMQIRDSVLEKFLINIKDVLIPEGIIVIDKSCFFDKKGIVSVILPKTLTKIDSRAFRNCINLQKVIFQNNDVEICIDAFKNCTTIKTVILQNGDEYELKGLPAWVESTPDLVKKIHSQIIGNFLIRGTTLIKYRGAEERVVVPNGVTVIGEKAFADNEAIGRVILPDSIKEIHEEAFADCVLLQSINFPDGLIHIGKAAFENCVKLLRAELPDSIKSLSKSIFSRCRKLSEVNLGIYVKEIGKLAFYSCTSLKHIEFPETLLSIGDLSFYKCQALTEIILSKNILHLGSNVFTLSGAKYATIACDLTDCGTDVFSQCDKLKKITFSEGVTHIGDKFAFACRSLKTVAIPSSVVSVGQNAFEGSEWINVRIKATDVELLTPVSVQALELSAAFVAGILWDGRNLSGHVLIQEGVMAIAGGAFYGNTKIISVSIPHSVQRIGSRAFCGCSSLENILLPKDIKTLSEGIFAYCTALHSVSTQGKITLIEDNAFYNCTNLEMAPVAFAEHIGKNAFSGCNVLARITTNCSEIMENAFKCTLFLASLRQRNPLVIINGTVVDGSLCTGVVELPQGVTDIAPYAFASNDNIFCITMPDSLLRIREGAFWNCKNLKEVHIKSKLNLIGDRAFEKCISLTYFRAYANQINDNAFSYCINLTHVQILGTGTVGKEVFIGCDMLETCFLQNATHISEGCFSGCELLTAFDLSNIDRIGERAFFSCNSLKEISLRDTAAIGAHAFEDCGRLRYISLPQVLWYGSYAFSGCTALKQITYNKVDYHIHSYFFVDDPQIPVAVKSIYDSALGCFDIDESLTINQYYNNGRLIHIPKGIQRIGDDVFKDCMNLEEIIIPETVTAIGARAFFSTPWLEWHKKQKAVVVVNDILVDGTRCEGDVYIPDNIRSVAGWAFANGYGITSISFSSKTTICEYAFRNCINLKHAVMDGQIYGLNGIDDREKDYPSTINRIFGECLNCFKTDDNGQLMECTGNIRDLTMPSGIKAIGHSVFKDSNLLTRLTVNNEVTFIGNSAFEQCRWLISVENMGNVRHIGKRAFFGCARLEHIILPDQLEELGIKAFENCTAIKTIIIPEGISEIPERAFFRCRNLASVTLPKTLQRIGREAFAFCDELCDINIPTGIVMEDRAFAWCPKIERNEADL